MGTNGTVAPGVGGGERPPLKVVAYGDAGAGKTTFAATFPKPMLVIAWDPIGKEMPYLATCKRVGPMATKVVGSVNGADVTVPMRQGFTAKGNLAVQVEHYIDRNPRAPEAYAKFLARWAVLEDEYDFWKTIVLDSVTFMELMARKDHQYRLNPTARDPRQWFGGSTDLLEEMLMIQVGALPMNVVVIAHIDEDKDEVNGIFVRNPKAPGRLGKGKGLAAAAVEVYRVHLARQENGSAAYMLQTASNADFNCATRIGAPNPCPPNYKALWANSKLMITQEGETNETNVSQ